MPTLIYAEELLLRINAQFFIIMKILMLLFCSCVDLFVLLESIASFIFALFFLFPQDCVALFIKFYTELIHRPKVLLREPRLLVSQIAKVTLHLLLVLIPAAI